MSKELSPLNALEELVDGLEDEHLDLSKSEWVVESKQIIETALKALEIIKEKSVDVFQFQITVKLTNLNEYNESHTKCFQLTQQEYDLLKEVLL